MNLPISLLKGLVSGLTAVEWDTLLDRLTAIVDAWNEGDKSFELVLKQNGLNWVWECYIDAKNKANNSHP
jgi:hypothetical protein